jgi:hypothetical protein
MGRDTTPDITQVIIQAITPDTAVEGTETTIRPLHTITMATRRVERSASLDENVTD